MRVESKEADFVGDSLVHRIDESPLTAYACGLHVIYLTDPDGNVKYKIEHYVDHLFVRKVDSED